MNIAQKIDRGVSLVAQIAQLQEELKGIEESIREHARRHPEDHKPLGDEEREGRQYLAKGEGFTVPVVFTADKIVGEFAYQGPKHIAIEKVSGDHFKDFFKPFRGYANRFDDGKKFRDKADELLGENAPAFVTACKSTDKEGIPKSDVKIEWKQAAAAAKLAELGSEVAA